MAVSSVFVGVLAQQATANEPLALKNRLDSGYQITLGKWFMNISPCAEAKSFSHYIRRRFLTEKQDFPVRNELLHMSANFYPIQPRKTDVEQNQVWFQFAGFLNCFQSI